MKTITYWVIPQDDFLYAETRWKAPFPRHFVKREDAERVLRDVIGEMSLTGYLPDNVKKHLLRDASPNQTVEVMAEGTKVEERREDEVTHFKVSAVLKWRCCGTTNTTSSITGPDGKVYTHTDQKKEYSPWSPVPEDLPSYLRYTPRIGYLSVCQETVKLYETEDLG